MFRVIFSTSEFRYRRRGHKSVVVVVVVVAVVVAAAVKPNAVAVRPVCVLPLHGATEPQPQLKSILPAVCGLREEAHTVIVVLVESERPETPDTRRRRSRII